MSLDAPLPNSIKLWAKALGGFDDSQLRREGGREREEEGEGVQLLLF